MTTLPDNRRGLNCTFAYQGATKMVGYKVRCSAVSHGLNLAYTESATRTRRTFYPHHLSVSQFAVQVDLLGQSEYQSFTNWLADYMQYAMTVGFDSETFPYMTVVCPDRNFKKKGIPRSGYEWGDTAGKVYWPVVVSFSGVEDDYENVVTKYSQVTGADGDPNKYFYPKKEQISGDWAAHVDNSSEYISPEQVADESLQAESVPGSSSTSTISDVINSNTNPGGLSGASSGESIEIGDGGVGSTQSQPSAPSSSSIGGEVGFGGFEND